MKKLNLIYYIEDFPIFKLAFIFCTNNNKLFRIKLLPKNSLNKTATPFTSQDNKEFPNLELYKIHADKFIKQNHDFLNLTYASRKELSLNMQEIIESVSLYFYKSQDILISKKILFLNQLSEFSKHVLLNLKNIKFGKTISYKKLAAISGSPNAYRAIGNILNNNPFPLVLPCHRIIKSSGELGGFDPGIDLKKQLIEFETKNSKS